MSISLTTLHPSLPCYQVRRGEGKRPFDGSQAVVLRDFSFPWEPTPPPLTEFSALWDDESLHFRFVCEDADLILAAGETVKDRVMGSDRVEIFLTPGLELDPYYAFEISPQAEVLAYSAQTYRQYDWDWAAPELHPEAEIRPRGYEVRGSIPLAVLRSLEVLKPDAKQFYAGVFRAEFSRQPDGSIHSGWMPWVNPHTERPDFHVPSAFGIFELVD